MNRWEYRDRWALVTGASSGLGEILADRLARRGMHLVVTARRVERLERLADRLARDHAVQVVPIAADLARPGDPTHVWSSANDGRRIDLLVNNAGFGARGLFHEVPIERHREMVEVNCLAVMELAHHAVAAMRPRGYGGIINVASLAAFQPVPFLGSYAATKAFVLSLSEALWAENQDLGLRILALCPGRTPTEFQTVAGTGNAGPAFGYRTPEEVVDAGLAAFDRGRGYVVPGFENLATTWLVRALPRSAVNRAMRRIMRKVFG